jgi:sugar/nucleoside kinase (ribokinase family)
MPRLLVVGHLTLDAICNQVTQTANFDLPQGAALGCAVASASNGAEVHIASVIGPDYPSQALEALNRYGIRTDHIERRSRPTLRFWLLRESNTYCVDHPYLATPITDYTPEPSGPRGGSFQNFDAAHICPMPLQDQLDWIRLLKRSVPLISVDPQPFRYALAGVQAEALFADLLREVDILSISSEDFPQLTGSDVSIGLVRLLACGPKIVTLKMGEHGSAVGATGRDHYLAVAAIEGSIEDMTCAGDAYAGAFLATYAATRDLTMSARNAAATAYVTIRKIGVLHVLESSSEIEVLSRERTQVVTISHSVAGEESIP